MWKQTEYYIFLELIIDTSINLWHNNICDELLYGHRLIGKMVVSKTTVLGSSPSARVHVGKLTIG